MACKLLVLLIIVSCAFSCERFTFEEGFDELFSAELGLCPIMLGTSWAIGTFESLNMEAFHERSTQFIYPDQLISCVSSPDFDMVPGGIIEVNIFMANSGPGNIIQVMVLDEFNADAGAGTEVGSSFPGAWSTIRITIIGNSPFRGRISIIGVASEQSIVLVDSFRYLPPGISEIDCFLYKTDDDDSDNITTNITTIDTIYHTTDGTVDYTTNPTTIELTDYNTHETTDVTNYDTSTDDVNKNIDGTTFVATEDVTDATTVNITNDSTTINDATDNTINHTTNDIIDHTTDDTFDHIIDYTTLYTTDDTRYDATSGGPTLAVTDGTTDSTDVIPTETTIEDKSGEDISTSPRPTCEDRKDNLIVRLKIAISVAVNVSAEVVAPLARIIN